jgi:hypothetical protein
MTILAIVALCAIRADAAIILVSKGVIATGTDTSGLFGAPSDLSGKAYKMSINPSTEGA